MGLHRWRATAVAVTGVLGLTTGCAGLPAARMALPAELRAAVVESPIDGIGGGRSGQWSLGEYRGEFTRSAERLSFFDVVENRKGALRFSVAGPGLEQPLEADCRMRERVITIKVVTFDSRPMALRCEFRAGAAPMAARFELQEAGGVRGAVATRQERRGELAVPRVMLTMRSVHAVEGSPLALAAPIGYVLEREGVPVGAVEINGRPRVLWRSDADEELRRAIVVGAVALGVFWDPAQTAAEAG